MPIHIPAAARNLTSPRPRPWIFRHSKYSRRNSQKINPIAAPSAGGFDAGHQAADNDGFRQPQSGNGQVQPVRNDPVADVDPGKASAEQAKRCEKSKKYGVGQHASLARKIRQPDQSRWKGVYRIIPGFTIRLRTCLRKSFFRRMHTRHHSFFALNEIILTAVFYPRNQIEINFAGAKLATQRDLVTKQQTNSNNIARFGMLLWSRVRCGKIKTMPNAVDGGLCSVADIGGRVSCSRRAARRRRRALSALHDRRHRPGSERVRAICASVSLPRICPARRRPGFRPAPAGSVRKSSRRALFPNSTRRSTHGPMPTAVFMPSRRSCSAPVSTDAAGETEALVESSGQSCTASFATCRSTPQGLLDGTVRLAYEVGESKADGGESRISGTSLDDMRNNVAGIDFAYRTIFATRAQNGRR